MDAKKNLNRRTKRSSKGAEENYWDCSVCTYRNSAEAFKCLMCDVRKGTSTRKPRINPQLVAQQVAQQYTQSQPKQKSSNPKQDKDKKSASDKAAKKIRPRLKNIDRSSAQQKAVTVNNVTVIITEFQPKRRLSSDNATNGPQSSSGNSTDSSQSDSASHSEVQNGDAQSDLQMLVKEGYTKGIDVRGAPYDYRKAPNEMAEYYKALKNLTEETYEMNGKTRITYVCHSMGCPIMIYFFNRQTQEWKDQHVKSLVTLGGAWGGAVKAMKAYASGENLGVFVINQLSVRKEQRTCPSLAYMMPSDILWSKDEILVKTETKNYTVTNFYDFFQDIEYHEGYEMWKDTYNLTRTLIPPDVEIHCIHGVNVTNTIERLDYTKNNFPDNPGLVYGDGDGTVNIRSLQACLRWQKDQKQSVFHVPLANVDHMGILADINVLEYIKKVVHQW